MMNVIKKLNNTSRAIRSHAFAQLFGFVLAGVTSISGDCVIALEFLSSRIIHSAFSFRLVNPASVSHRVCRTMDAHTKGLLLGFGLVMLSVIAAIVVKQFQSGGSGFSHLDKTLEVPLNKVNLDFHKQAFQKRLNALGFKPVDRDGDFIQGGADLSEFGAASHAKTKKLFTLRFQDSGNDQFLARLTLRYLGLVVVDTGESAYRDAVLDYVSGKTEEMKTVPTESLLALNSLVGGMIACVVAAVLVMSDQLPLWTAIPSLGVTEFAVGLLAIASIAQKPAEITGRGKAIAGILLSLAAIGVSLYFIITAHSGSAI